MTSELKEIERLSRAMRAKPSIREMMEFSHRRIRRLMEERRRKQSLMPMGARHQK